MALANTPTRKGEPAERVPAVGSEIQRSIAPTWTAALAVRHHARPHHREISHYRTRGRPRSRRDVDRDAILRQSGERILCIGGPGLHARIRRAEAKPECLLLLSARPQEGEVFSGRLFLGVGHPAGLK